MPVRILLFSVSKQQKIELGQNYIWSKKEEAAF